MKKAIRMVVACTRNVVVLMEEIRKAMKLKNKKSSVSEGYKVQVSFFLKISNQFARELSLNPPARKTL